MTIPKEAIGAAAEAMSGVDAFDLRALATDILEAAAPHMLAAWEAERNLEYKADEARREWLDDKEVEL
ncbi:hypothetical protein AB0N33_01025 [Pseudarthrobacter oxydans]|uniref:hypothetical protein n=1 Tax=Pseudarthrobacter oxydans TaxID=1671 RepID=UPI00342D518F